MEPGARKGRHYISYCQIELDRLIQNSQKFCYKIIIPSQYLAALNGSAVDTGDKNFFALQSPNVA
jgi:hypothetical protein